MCFHGLSYLTISSSQPQEKLYILQVGVHMQYYMLYYKNPEAEQLSGPSTEYKSALLDAQPCPSTPPCPFYAP